LCLGLVQGDAAQLPLASSRFDFILCVHTLEHLPEDDPTLEELHRILKKDSYLRLVVPNSLKQMLSIFRPLERRLSELGHLREYSLEAIMELLPPHHFEIHQIYYSDFLLSWVLFSAEEHLRSLVRRSSFARTIKRLMLRSRRASYPFTAVLGLLLFWENKLLRNCSWGMNICCIAQRIE
jgi:ubiquinone/menaquinone biosynthesis C-methylase UbiE